MEKVFDVAIVGEGAAGVMGSLRSVLNNHKSILIGGTPKNKKKSRAMWVRKIENMPDYFSYSKGIVDPNKKTLDWILESEFRDNFEYRKSIGVEKIEKKDEFFELILSSGEVVKSQYVLLCTGMMDVQPEISGSIQPLLPYANIQMADYCLRCDGHHVLGKEVAVIGHTSSAAWVSVMLHERYAPPSMKILTHGKKHQFSHDVLSLIRKYNIEINECEITDVVGDPKEGYLDGFTVDCKDFVKADFAFVSLGVIVYNDLAKSLNADLDDRGFVVTDLKGQSSVEGLYAAGDLRAGIKKQVYTAWDSAVDAVDDIDMKLRAKRRNQTNS